MNDSDSLKLSGEALRLFFEKQTLYQLDDREIPEPEAFVEKENIAEKNIPLKKYHWHGSGTSGFWMIFDHDGTDALHPDWEAMIVSLVENPKAMNKKREDLAMMNLRLNQQFDWLDFISLHHVKKVIFWGKAPEEVAASLSLYQPSSHGGITMMLAHFPQEVQADRAIKNELWLQIQKTFL